jgi:hypothetical protein
VPKLYKTTGVGRAVESLPWLQWANDDPTATAWARYDAGTESRLVPLFPKGGETITTTQPLYRFETEAQHVQTSNNNTTWRVDVRKGPFGPHNRLVYSQDFDNAAWNAIAVPVVPNVSLDHLGNLTADRLTISAGFTARRAVVGGLTVGKVYYFKVRVRAAPTSSAANVRVAINDTVSWASAVSTRVALTSNIQEVRVTWTATGTSAYVIVGALDAAGAADSSCYGDVDVSCAQFTESVDTDYVATTSAAVLLATTILFTATSDPGRNEVNHPLATPLTPGKWQWRYHDPDNGVTSGWIDFEVDASAVTLNIPKRLDLYNAFKARPIGERGWPAVMTHYQAGGHARAHYTALDTGTSGLSSFIGASISGQTDEGNAAQTEYSRIITCAQLYKADGHATAGTHGLARLQNILGWQTGRYAPTNIVVSGGGTLATINFPTPTRFLPVGQTKVAIDGASHANLTISLLDITAVNSQTFTFVPSGVPDGTYTATWVTCRSLSHRFDDQYRFKILAIIVGASAFWGLMSAADKAAARDHVGYTLQSFLYGNGWDSSSFPLWINNFQTVHFGRWAWHLKDHGGHMHEWMLVMCGAAALFAGDEPNFTGSHFGLATTIPEFTAAASVLLHKHYVSNTELGGNYEGLAYHGFAFYYTAALDLMLNALGILDAWWTQPRWRNAAKMCAFGMRKGTGPRLANGDDGYGVWDGSIAITAGCKTASPYLPLILRSQGVTINNLDTSATWPFPHLQVPNVALPSLDDVPTFERDFYDHETTWYATDDPTNGDSPTFLVNVLRRGRFNHGLGGASGFQAAAGGRRLIVQGVNLRGTVGITDQHKTNWGNSSRSASVWALNGLVGTQCDGLNTGPQNRAIPLKYKPVHTHGYLQLDLTKAYRRASYVHTSAVRTFVFFRPGLMLILDRAAWTGSLTFEWQFHTPTAPTSAGVGSDISLFGVTSTSAVRTVDSLEGGVLTPIAGTGIVAPTAQVINDSAWPAGCAPPANSIANADYPESPNGTLDDANHVYWHNYVQWAASTGVFSPMRLQLGSNRVSGETAGVSGGVFTWSATYAGRTCTVSLNLTTNALTVTG